MEDKYKTMLEKLYQSNNKYIVNTILGVSISFTLSIYITGISASNILQFIGFSSVIIIQLYLFNLAKLWCNNAIEGKSDLELHSRVEKIGEYRAILFYITLASIPVVFLTQLIKG